MSKTLTLEDRVRDAEQIVFKIKATKNISNPEIFNKIRDEVLDFFDNHHKAKVEAITDEEMIEDYSKKYTIPNSHNYLQEKHHAMRMISVIKQKLLEQ